MGILELTINEYQKKGWILINQTSRVAQLRKPKAGFNFFIGLILFICGVVPGIIYLIAVMAKKEETITLYLDDYAEKVLIRK